MNGILIFAIITITLALVFYTIGVFGERKAKTLGKKTCDSILDRINL